MGDGNLFNHMATISNANLIKLSFTRKFLA